MVVIAGQDLYLACAEIEQIMCVQAEQHLVAVEQHLVAAEQHPAAVEQL